MTTSSSTKYTAKLSNHRVLILGGTSGIGFAVAEACVEHGAFVFISSSRQAKLENAIERLKSSYPDSASRIAGQTCDLAQTQQQEANLHALMGFASADCKLDHIVFTAGNALKRVPIAEATPATILEGGNVRFLGALMLAKLAPKYMSDGPKSSITLTGGSMSTKPAKGWTVMASWGAAGEGMTRGLAVDLAPIRVNMVSPGAVHTELFGDIPKDRLDSVLQSFKEAALTNEVGRPEDLAEAYLYVMKDHFITGAILESNGGRLLK